MSNKIVSMFTAKYNELMTVGNVDELKQKLLTIVKEANDGAMISRKITLNVVGINSLLSLQKYVTNSMLRYQGMGLNRY